MVIEEHVAIIIASITGTECEFTTIFGRIVTNASGSIATTSARYSDKSAQAGKVNVGVSTVAGDDLNIAATAVAVFG